jgi:hypothetical protein
MNWQWALLCFLVGGVLVANDVPVRSLSFWFIIASLVLARYMQ